MSEVKLGANPGTPAKKKWPVPPIAPSPEDQGKFLVWNLNGHAPRKRHDTFEAAQAEADRLGRKYYRAFYVLEVKAVQIHEPEPIAVPATWATPGNRLTKPYRIALELGFGEGTVVDACNRDLPAIQIKELVDSGYLTIRPMAKVDDEGPRLRIRCTPEGDRLLAVSDRQMLDPTAEEVRVNINISGWPPAVDDCIDAL